MPKSSHNKGFTLIELLVVLTILAILATVLIVALNPIKRFSETRNVRRSSHVRSISIAIYEYITEEQELPSGIGETERQIGTADAGCDIACSNASSSCVDLSEDLEPYLLEIPKDPQTGTPQRTHYSVTMNENGILIVKACSAELGKDVRIVQ